MSAWEQEIEDDLAWRESEMGALKLLLAAAQHGSDRQRALLRACSAMLYAHYEGFCKFCWTILLGYVNAEGLKRCEVVTPLAKRAMLSVFKSLRANSSSDNLWKFATVDFKSELDGIAEFSEEVDTKSNLWPNLSKEINASVGLLCPILENKHAEIYQLVDRRNKIAHGEKLEIVDIQRFQAIEHAAVLVMHELAIAVVRCLDDRAYLVVVPDPAAFI